MSLNDASDWFMDPNDWFIDADQLSPCPSLSDLAMPSGSNSEDLPLFDFLDNDTNHSNMLADSQIEEILGEIDGLDEAQSELFDINSSDLIDSLAVLPINNSVHDNPPPTEENSNKSFVVKSSDTKNTTNFVNGNGFYRTGRSLQLKVPPFSHQRARYEGELDKTLRYIFVLYNALLTLKISDLPSNIAPAMSFWMRITRTTTPYGSDNLLLCHPYPIWLNDKDGKVYNGSLFLPIIGETIEIEKLVLQRSKQDVLGKIKQFPIFTSNQLDFNNFHSTNTNKAKDIIKKYKLAYSILHFQIIFVDQNNNAYPTDMECQTEPIYEYEGKELNNLPANVRNIQKQSVKRKQIGQRKESLIKTNMKQMAKNHTRG